MILVVLQAIEIFIALATRIALVWLVLLHAQCSRIRGRCFRIDDREGAISIVVQGLRVVAML